MEIITDKMLVTESDIRARLVSIRKQREILCDTPCRSNSINAFTAKQAKIAKLTTREGLLCNKLKLIKEAV